MGLSRHCRAAPSPGSLQEFPQEGSREGPWLSKHGKDQKNLQNPKGHPRGDLRGTLCDSWSSITSRLLPCAAEPAFFIFTFPLTPHIILNLALC